MRSSRFVSLSTAPLTWIVIFRLRLVSAASPARGNSGVGHYPTSAPAGLRSLPMYIPRRSGVQSLRVGRPKGFFAGLLPFPSPTPLQGTIQQIAPRLDAERPSAAPV